MPSIHMDVALHGGGGRGGGGRGIDSLNNMRDSVFPYPKPNFTVMFARDVGSGSMSTRDDSNSFHPIFSGKRDYHDTSQDVCLVSGKPLGGFAFHLALHDLAAILTTVVAGTHSGNQVAFASRTKIPLFCLQPVLEK